MAVRTAWRILGQQQDAEDAVQEALFECLQLKPGRKPLEWGAWIRVVVTRRSIDLLRKRKRANVIDPQSLLNRTSSEPNPDSAALESELAERLREAMAELSDHEAAVFSLSHLSGLENNEIVAALGISVSNVSSTLHKARQKLKIKLAAYFE